MPVGGKFAVWVKRLELGYRSIYSCHLQRELDPTPHTAHQPSGVIFGNVELHKILCQASLYFLPVEMRAETRMSFLPPGARYANEATLSDGITHTSFPSGAPGPEARSCWNGV